MVDDNRRPYETLDAAMLVSPMPAEPQWAMLSLILSDAFEQVPESLRICFVHDGGSFAYLLGRVDNDWRYRDIVHEGCPQLPSSYTNRFYVDSAIFDDNSLTLLTQVMGTDRVMLGSDSPFPLGEQSIGLGINDHPTFGEDDKKRMLGENALRFLIFGCDLTEAQQR